MCVEATISILADAVFGDVTTKLGLASAEEGSLSYPSNIDVSNDIDSIRSTAFTSVSRALVESP